MDRTLQHASTNTLLHGILELTLDSTLVKDRSRIQARSDRSCHIPFPARRWALDGLRSAEVSISGSPPERSTGFRS